MGLRFLSFSEIAAKPDWKLGGTYIRPRGRFCLRAVQMDFYGRTLYPRPAPKCTLIRESGPERTLILSK